MTAHEYWLLKWCYKMLEREGILDKVDPEIVADLEFTLITANPRNK